MINESIFEDVGIGIVVTGNEPYSPLLEVSPIDKLTDVSVTLSEYKAKMGDVDLGATLTAVWYNLHGTMQPTPTTLSQGEVVRLFKLKGNDTVLWDTLMLDIKLRRQGTYTAVLSNVPKGESGEAGKDKSHWVNFDAIKGILEGHTSNNNGEPTPIDVKLDIGKGIFTLEDTFGNSIVYNFTEGEWTLKTTNTVNLIADNTVNVTAPKVTINASNSVTIDTPVTTLTGKLKVGSSIYAEGSITNPKGYVHRH